MPTELLLYFNDVLVYLICLIKMLSRARLTHRREEVLCQTMQGWTQSGAKCTRVKKPVAERVGCCKWLPSPSWVKGLWSRPFFRNFFELLSQNCALLRTMFIVCILEGAEKSLDLHQSQAGHRAKLWWTHLIQIARSQRPWAHTTQADTSQHTGHYYPFHVLVITGLLSYWLTNSKINDNSTIYC